MAKTIPSLLTVADAQRLLADRVKTCRLAAGFKQTTLAQRSGVSLGSLKRFEDSGEISLKNLLRLAMALGCIEDIKNLFEPPKAKTLAELDRLSAEHKPKRGRI